MKRRLLFLFVLLMTTAITQANTITVTNINDSGAGSLRQAAIDASAGDTIRFNPNLLTAAVDSISLSTDIDFGNKGIVIKGLYTATDTLFISGANSSRIFSFDGAGNVVLDSLVLINGYGASFTIFGRGGAVYYKTIANDTLFVLNSTFRNNSTTYGGGIFFEGDQPSALLMVSNSNIINNTAQYGGGVHAAANNSSSVTVNNSTFSKNTATTTGGGIYSNTNAGNPTVTITNSTFSENTSGGTAGGINCTAYTGNATVTINNSTFSENTANGTAGGIYSGSVLGIASVEVSNSTLSKNTSPNGIGGISCVSTTSNSYITCISSIFSENNGTSNGFFTLFHTLNGYNIFSNDPFPGSYGTGDQINVTQAALNLQPLADNGGNTTTMIPGSGSVAVNMGNPADLSNAQNGPIVGIRDVGAAEGCPSETKTDTVTACASYVWRDGNTYTATDSTTTYTVAGVATDGCDSVYTLNLTIELDFNYSQAIYLKNEANPTPTQPSATGGTYSATPVGLVFVNNSTGEIDIANSQLGTYTVQYNVTGTCSGSFQRTVEIACYNNATTDTVLAIQSYTWIDGTTYNSDNTTATHTLQNQYNCDSVVTLNLTVCGTSSETLSPLYSMISVDSTINFTVSNSITGATYTLIDNQTNSPVGASHTMLISKNAIKVV